VTVELPKEIRVESDRTGAPRITIDGQPLPWYTAGIVVPPPALGQAMPTVTITIPAEKVTMVNEMMPPAAEDSRGDE
jgi:hypothetical protein